MNVPFFCAKCEPIGVLLDVKNMKYLSSSGLRGFGYLADDEAISLMGQVFIVGHQDKRRPMFFI